MKKCCLNCAFCVRQINDSSNTLTVEEHKQALSNNFSFIGEAKRYQQAWQLQYKQIYEEKVLEQAKIDQQKNEKEQLLKDKEGLNKEILNKN